MATVLYPKGLLEKWANVGVPAKHGAAPVIEASGNEFGRSGEDAGDDEVDKELGRFSDIVDYEGDSDMGYSEPGVNQELDNQYSRLGINVQEIDPETGLPSEPAARPARKRKTASSGDSAKLLRDGIRARRLADAKAVYREIAGISEQYLGYFGGPAAEMPADMREIAEDIAGRNNDGMDDGSADSYIRESMELIRSMEKLGIAARRNNMVPDGIPHQLIDAPTISSLIYLSGDEMGLLNSDQMDTSDKVRMISTTRLAKRVAALNQHMAGLGNDDEPLMPPADVKLYTSSFAPWEEVGAKSDTHRATRTDEMKIPGHVNLAGSERYKFEYLGTMFSSGATAMVPHPLYERVRDAILNDNTVMRKKAREEMMKEFGNSADVAAANLFMYGYKDVSKRFGVAPVRIHALTGAPCFIGIPKDRGGAFTSTAACLKAMCDMIAAYRDEIAKGRAKLVDFAGNVFTSFPAAYLSTTRTMAHSQEKTISTVEFLDRIFNEANKNLSGSAYTIKEFISPDLYTLIEKSFSLKRNARRIRVNGEWQMSSGEPVPLFDYFSTGINTSRALDINAGVQHGGSISSTENRMQVGETISYDNVMEMNNDRTASSVLAGYADAFLEDDRSRAVCELLGMPTDNIPSAKSPEKVKVGFFTDLMLKLSDIMVDLGSNSYLVRRPGNVLEDVVSDEDKARYGQDVRVIDIWKKIGMPLIRDTWSGDASQYSPDTVRFLAGNVRAKRGIFTFAGHILDWIRSFQAYDFDSNDIVAMLTAYEDDFKKAKEVLTPYVEMVPLVIAIAGSDTIGGAAGRNSPGFRFAIKFINQLQKEANSSILSPDYIDRIVKYAKRTYGGVNEMLEHAQNDAPYNWTDLLEWCVVRFLMSGIDRVNDRLVPPDQVDAVAGEAGETSVPPILKKYREILAAKPPYLKRDAWLRQNNIKPDMYDYLEQEASGKVPDARIIDMSAGEISGWLSDDYIKSGNRGEIIMLLLGLIYIGTLSSDSDLRAISRFKEDGATESAHSSIMYRLVPLPVALSEYGRDTLGGIIGDLVGDDGRSLSTLLEILSSDEPFTMDELATVLDAGTGEPEPGDDSEDEVVSAMGSLLGKLTSAPFLVFNGIG